MSHGRKIAHILGECPCQITSAFEQKRLPLVHTLPDNQWTGLPKAVTSLINTSIF